MGVSHFIVIGIVYIGLLQQLLTFPDNYIKGMDSVVVIFFFLIRHCLVIVGEGWGVQSLSAVDVCKERRLQRFCRVILYAACAF